MKHLNPNSTNMSDEKLDMCFYTFEDAVYEYRRNPDKFISEHTSMNSSKRRLYDVFAEDVWQDYSIMLPKVRKAGDWPCFSCDFIEIVTYLIRAGADNSFLVAFLDFYAAYCEGIETEVPEVFDEEYKLYFQYSMKDILGLISQ